MQVSAANYDNTASRPSVFPVQSAILSGILVLVPTLVLLNRGVIWPLMYGHQLYDPSGLYGGLGVYGPHILHKVWFPLLLAITVFLFAIARVRQPNYHLALILPWLLFFGWSALSVSWAIEPGVALSRLILQLLVAGCLYLTFCGTNRPKDILTCVYWLMIATALVNLYAVLTQVPTTLGYRGIFQHKNTLGSFCVMVIFLALLKLPDGRRYWLSALVVLPICLFMLIESQSKTSFGLLFMMFPIGCLIAFFAWGLRIPGVISFLIGGAALAALSFGLSAALGFSFPQQIEAMTGDATLTGRTDLWRFAWDYIEAEPLFGYGFRSFWQIGSNSPSLSMGFGFIATATHAHNAYIDFILSGGIIGLLLILPILATSLNLCGRISKKRVYEGTILSSFVAFALLHNILETTFLFGVNVPFVIFQIIWLYMVYTVDPIADEKTAAKPVGHQP